MSVFPYYDTERKQIVDGTCFRLIPYCNKNCVSQRCKQYYESLEDAPSGSYKCPHGLSSYVYNAQNKKLIFTGIKIKGKYDKQRTKGISAQDYCFNPVVEEAICNSVANEIAVTIHENAEKDRKTAPINDLLHETRALNGQIRSLTDSYFEEHFDDDTIDSNRLLEIIKNVQVCSYMISNRFLYLDSVLNPTLPQGSSYSAVIFGKFDKMRKLLKGYMRKNVWISLNTPEPSKYRYNIYPSFETLIFVLLENAIKYSPNNQPVDVNFKERGSILDVEIVSVGPYCTENEITRLCEKGFRSENAQIMQKQGQGFGLNFANEICKAHKIGLSFDSIYLNKDHGVKYGRFYVKLRFDNACECQ